ncbi:unnamed protein product [Ixodes pacificus]
MSLSGALRAGVCPLGSTGCTGPHGRLPGVVLSRKPYQTYRPCVHCVSGPGSWERPSSRHFLAMSVEESVGSFVYYFGCPFKRACCCSARMLL